MVDVQLIGLCWNILRCCPDLLVTVALHLCQRFHRSVCFWSLIIPGICFRLPATQIIFFPNSILNYLCSAWEILYFSEFSLKEMLFFYMIFASCLISPMWTDSESDSYKYLCIPVKKILRQKLNVGVCLTNNCLR